MPWTAILNNAEVSRTAPCGAELATGRTRKLAGAPLYRRVEKQLREGELAEFELPLHLYDCKVEQDYPSGSTESGWFFTRSLESLTATFTHRKTGAQIVVSEIWADDNGMIVQRGSNYGHMVL